MELYLQFGYGMMGHCRELIDRWGGGTVILSPRDLSEDQMTRLSHDIRASDGEVLLDPQFYIPHASHTRLTAQRYWPENYETSEFWSGQQLNQLLSELASLNEDLECSRVILPGLYAHRVDQDWIATQEAVLEGAEDIIEGETIITATLSEEATRDEKQIHRLLDQAAEWSCAGYYVVCEHPKGEYLVTDAVWVANVLDLVAGLRLRGKDVILGYCSHQMLIAACASASAIASGTWMNVRSFPPDKFHQVYEDEIRQRTTWYYCPQALSEYKITFLDIAHRLGVLNNIAPEPPATADYCEDLFSGDQPTTVGFGEQQAFRHYLDSLQRQTAEFEQGTFKGTVEHYSALLDQAEELLGVLHSRGIRGQHRDFGEIVDVNRAALEVLRATRGPMLNRQFPEA